MACKEVRAFEKRIASLLADKWNRPYSELVGYIRGRMAMSILRSNTVCLRGARVRRWTVPCVADGVRGDAGENGGVEAGLQGMWLHTMDKVITREYEYGRISTGE